MSDFKNIGAERTKTQTHAAEFYILSAFLVTLPIMESPKNILWGLLVVVWLYNRVRKKNFGGKWDLWDSLIALWIVSGYIVAAFAGLHHKEWKGAHDILQYGAIFWIVKRSYFSRTEIRWLLILTILSTFIALCFSFWSLFVVHRIKYLELHSVGHVNHSAIYLVISCGALISAMLAFWEKMKPIWRISGVALLIVFTDGIFISASRAAVGTLFPVALIIGIIWLRRSYLPLVAILAALLLVVSAAYFTKTEVVAKHIKKVERNRTLNGRGPIWNVALEAWKEYPAFGVGMGNYGDITVEKLKVWIEASGREYDTKRYSIISHAHNLYLNTLAERGTFGFGVLLTVLITWAVWLVRFLPEKNDANIIWALWGSAFGGWLTTVGVGFVNTTLHHEHAALSVVLLGLWLSSLRFGNSKQNNSKS